MGQAKEKAEHGQSSRKIKTPGAEHATPSWRQVEALRERQALIKELSDIWSEDPELDDSIFFTDKQSKAFYQRPARLNKEDFEINEDDEPGDDD